jgi:hypothetical protein
VIILNQISRHVLFELRVIHHVENINKTGEKYRQMPFVDWQEEAPFKKYGLPVITEQFWVGVLQHKAFKELATFVHTCLITPVSNAVVESTFSLISSVTTKTRNRMQLNLLNAIMRVRAELLLSCKCCKNFIVSPEILKNFISGKVYAVYSTHSSGEDSNDMDLELFMRYEYEKYIKICLAFFFGFLNVIAWFYIQMSMWQPW